MEDFQQVLTNLASSLNSVNSTAIKLPTFSPDLVEHWFDKVEAHFRIKKITVSNTKYDHVMATIPVDVFKKVGKIDISEDKDPYDTLKKKMIKRFSLSPLGLSIKGAGSQN